MSELLCDGDHTMSQEPGMSDSASCIRHAQGNWIGLGLRAAIRAQASRIAKTLRGATIASLRWQPRALISLCELLNAGRPQ